MTTGRRSDQARQRKDERASAVDLPSEAHALAGLGPRSADLIGRYSSKQPELLRSSEFRQLEPVAEALYTWDRDQRRDEEAVALIQAIFTRMESTAIDVSALRGWILSHPNDAAAVIECMNTLPPPGMKIIRMLSRKGSQKVVFLATWQLGLRQVVLKRLLGAPADRLTIQARESQTHPLTMPCRNIANTYTAQNSEGETFLVEEHLPVILSDEWRAPGLAEAANLTYDIICALSCLHSQLNLVHGDVNPDNIGKAGSRYLLLDFGICRPAAEFTGDVTGTGSLRTRAPELLEGNAYRGSPEIVKKVDTWALGATVFNAMVGRFPLMEPGEYVPRLDENERRAAFEATLRHRAASEWDQRVDVAAISEPLRSVLAVALRRDPGERASAKELMELTERDLAAYLRDNAAASDRGRFSPVEELQQYRDHLLRDSATLMYMPQGVRDQLKRRTWCGYAMCKVSMPHKALRSTRLLISWAKRLAAGSHSKNPGLGPWAHAIPRDGSHRHRLVTNGRVTAPQADPSDGSWLPGLPRRRALTPCPLPGSSSFGHSVRAPPAGSGAGCAGGTHASFGRFHSRFGDRSALPRFGSRTFIARLGA